MIHEPLREIERQALAQIDPARLRQFTRRVLRDLDTLEGLLRSGAVESGVRRLGAEQELFLVDRHWQPACAAERLLDQLGDPHYTCELGRFNLEINLEPMALSGGCFRRLEKELTERVDAVREVAGREGLAVILSGILPTLRLEHLTLEHMSPKPRYFALNEALNRLRGDEYAVHLRGVDELAVEHANVMLEACNTSFQVHYQVAPEEFAQAYNLAQAVAGPVLAAAVNSPLLFGRRLWAETRIPLFEQSIDTRTSVPPGRREVSRVSFGTRWVEESVLEIYREDVARFPALFAPQEEDGDPEQEEVPALRDLCRHNGTVYRWNRPCYGVLEGRPNLRIESRYLPSGPTLIDEVANGAFWCGLMRGAVGEYPQIHCSMPFEQAQKNFIQASRHGLDARFDWFEHTRLPARRLILSSLLPLAREGLRELEVDGADIEHYLGIIEERVETQRTGARFILDSTAEFGEKPPGSAELAALTAALHGRGSRGTPVAQWPKFSRREWSREPGNLLVRDLMTSNPFTVREEQPLDLAACLMDWRQIRHVPVEDTRNRLIGLVTYRSLLRSLVAPGAPDRLIPVGEVMLREVITVSPDSSLVAALDLMEEHEIGCLPVVHGDQLVGILSERDFLSLARGALDDEVLGAS